VQKKNFRNNRRRTYTEEQLVLAAEEKLVVKTHKGEAIFSAGEICDTTSTDILELLTNKNVEEVKIVDFYPEEKRENVQISEVIKE